MASDTPNMAIAVKETADGIAELVKELTAERPDVVLFALVETGMRIMKASGKTEAESLDVIIGMLQDMRKNVG